MKKVLVADTLPEQCTQMLVEAGFEVIYRPGLPEEELKEAARDVNGIICRSGAKVTAKVLESADALEAICRAGVGVDNIDVAAASRKGVVVMNTPGGNTISTAEHAFALMLGLARNIGPAYASMREGRWEKKKLTGAQLYGSSLGVVGLGRIGREMARRATAFGMTVRAYDPFVTRETAEKMGVELRDKLEDVLADCDYLTVHVPETEQTEGLIGAGQIALMKDGSCIINCARGSVLDQDAAVAAVRSGKLRGAAFDVYVKEPPDDYEFARQDGVLATPHLGASTEQAQLAVATEAAEELIAALQRGHFRNAVNVSFVPPEEMRLLQPYCDLAAHLGRFVAQLQPGRPEALEISYLGELAHDDVELVQDYGAMGLMQSSLGANVNVVSAPYLAHERGIRVTSSATVGSEAGFTDLVELRLTTDTGTAQAAGTVFGREYPRIVSIDGFHVELIPEGHILVVFGKDMPGLIGKVGAMLGDAGVNIARMGFGRREAGGSALLGLNLDSPCDERTAERIQSLGVVQRVAAIEL